MMTLPKLSRYQQRVYESLVLKDGQEQATRIMMWRLQSDLHPSMLMDRDYDAWMEWELDRIAGKDD